MNLRSRDRRFGALVWVDKHHCIAEGNLRLVELTAAGSLRVAFHRGDFSDNRSIERVVMASVETIADIEADVLGSFRLFRNAPRSECLVEVVPPPDNPQFATLVTEELEGHHARLRGRTRLVNEPHPVPGHELAAWYRRGVAVSDDQQEVDHWFVQFARHGLNIDTIDRRAALRERAPLTARRRRGGVLTWHRRIRRRDPARIRRPRRTGRRLSVGAAASLAPRIGVTGVVRGAERNAAVIAEADVDVLAIPAERYLADWFKPYTTDQLRTAWDRWLATRRS